MHITELPPRATMSDMADFVELADEHLLKLGKPRGFDEARAGVYRRWLDNPNVLEIFTRDYVGLTYGMLLAEIYHSVLCAADPALALRQKQVATLFNLARYSVILYDQIDDTAKGSDSPHLGITGGLEPYAQKISEFFEELPGWHVLDETPDALNQTLNEIEGESIYWAAKAHALADLAPLFEEDKDQRFWLAACLTAATSMWEHLYREALGLPPVLDVSKLDALYRMHSALLNICASGIKDPFLVWEHFKNVESSGSRH